MAKLTETATTILASAAARDDHRVLPLPKLKAPPVAIQKSLKALLADGLIEDVAAAREGDVWEQSDENGRRMLVINTSGLLAIGVEAAPVAADPANGRTKPAKGRTRGRSAGKAKEVAKKARRARTRADGAKKQSKQEEVISLLRRANGASVEEMMVATDWQAHSVRGFMSGALKKRLKLDVVSEKDKKTGERRYFVAAIK